MYSIQYYKSERIKPTLAEPNYSSNNRKLNYMARRGYLRQKDLIDKCWNIKSLTIDLNDIKNIIYDLSLIHLISLYAKVSRLNTDGIDTITILNNNLVNSLYIYEIINCGWMINREDFNYSEEAMLQKINELNTYIERYENLDKQDKKLKNKIHLLKYYINSATSKEFVQISAVKTLKLGKRIHIIKA